MKHHITVVVIVVGLTVLCCPAAQYDLTDLGEAGTLFGSLWRPLSINDVGDIGGTGPLSSGYVGAYVWRDGVTTYLSAGTAVDWANDINNDALSVGAQYVSAGKTLPCYWTYGSAVSLPTSVTSPSGEAVATNNVGTIVGYIYPPMSSRIAIASVWKDGPTGKQRLAIDKLYINDTYNYATDINDAGRVVGYSGNLGLGRKLAFLWHETESLVVLPPAAGDIASLAEAINNADQVAGTSVSLDGWCRAVIWQEQAPAMLPSNGWQSWANGLNEDGAVVGVCSTDQGDRAVLWLNEQLSDLTNALADQSGWVLTEAHDINNTGWIVGVGTTPTGQPNHGFLLIPRQDAIEAVIEFAPQTLNLKSNAPWLICTLQFEGVDITNVDVGSIRLAGQIAVESSSIDTAAQVLTMKFLRWRCASLLTPGEVTLSVSGQLLDGTAFQGQAVLYVKAASDKTGEKPRKPKR